MRLRPGGWRSGNIRRPKKQYDTGATDGEITIATIMPYNGPAAPSSAMARTQAGYFSKIKGDGGDKWTQSYLYRL
jgi:hypothetical protein